MKTLGMDAGDALAAKGAKAPRVTLDSMKKRVAREYYFTAGDAISKAGMPAGGPKDPLDVLTICVLVLDNGWTLLGKSAPASVENFDRDKGQQFAYEDALKQLWPLEGYLLRENLHCREIISEKTKVLDEPEHEFGEPFTTRNDPDEPLTFDD